MVESIVSTNKIRRVACGLMFKVADDRSRVDQGRTGKSLSLGCALTMLIGILASPLSFADEVLTLQGDTPMIVFDDNSFNLQKWDIRANDSFFGKIKSCRIKEQ